MSSVTVTKTLNASVGFNSDRVTLSEIQEFVEACKKAGIPLDAVVGIGPEHQFGRPVNGTLVLRLEWGENL